MKNRLFKKIQTLPAPALCKGAYYSVSGRRDPETSHLPISDALSLRWSGPATIDRQISDQVLAAHELQSIRYISDTRMMKKCPDIICTVDRYGRFVSINDACIRLWGYTPDEIEGRYFMEFVMPEDIDKTAMAGQLLQAGGNTPGVDNRYVHKDGTIIPMLWSMSWSEEDGLIYAVGRDGTAIKSVEATLQEGEQRYRSLFDHNPDAVFLLDMGGHFTSVNAQAEALTGMSREQLLGMSFYPLVAPEHMEATEAYYEKAKKGERLVLEIWIINARGERRYVKILSLPVIVNARMTGVYSIVTDITDKHDSKKELLLLNESLEHKIKERTCQLEQSMKELEAFSYSVSHDLRAPLRIINGYSKLLNNEYGEQFGPDGKEFMTAIIENTQYMGRLIDDLLNLSRLGREAINTTEVDMNGVVSVVRHEMRMDGVSPEADITVHILKSCICDQALIRQVWINLISNAIKYSKKKGQPKIEIGSYDKGNETVYYIRDNGAGFDMKFAAKLFGVFVRLHDRSEFDGTGVGLALVHRIISRHGGKVWANGKVDEGAVFYFSLPK